MGGKESNLHSLMRFRYRRLVLAFLSSTTSFFPSVAPYLGLAAQRRLPCSLAQGRTVQSRLPACSRCTPTAPSARTIRTGLDQTRSHEVDRAGADMRRFPGAGAAIIPWRKTRTGPCLLCQDKYGQELVQLLGSLSFLKQNCLEPFVHLIFSNPYGFE
jgi:hypothetical protein